MAISIKISLSTGKNFIITTRETNTFQYVFNKYIKIECPSNSVVYAILNNGSTVDMNKTLIENNITQNCTVLVMVRLSSLSENYGAKNKKNIFFKKQLNIDIEQNNLNKHKFKHENSFQTLIPKSFNIIETPLNAIEPPPTPFIIQTLPTIKPSPNIITPIHNFIEPSQNIIRQNPQIIPISENINNNIISPKLKIGISFLNNICKVPFELLEMNHLCDNNWDIGRKNGPPGYLKDYFPPHGWIGIRLKVLNLYDNGDITWLGNYNQKGEWYIAYHPIKTIKNLLEVFYIMDLERDLFKIVKTILI